MPDKDKNKQLQTGPVNKQFIALKMEAVRISETSFHFNVTTRRYIP
jgi:hypothetical protein